VAERLKMAVIHDRMPVAASNMPAARRPNHAPRGVVPPKNRINAICRSYSLRDSPKENKGDVFCLITGRNDV
jgi:hypothetical protein